MPFGNLASNVQHYYYEAGVETDLGNYGIGAGGAVNFNVASITMPWTGDVMVDLYVQMVYTPTILGCELWPASNIGPTNFWAGKKQEFSHNGGWLVCPLYCRWSNLAVGTFLQVGIQVKCRAANGSVNCIRCVGSLRAQAK